MNEHISYRAQIPPVPDGAPRPFWSVMIPTYHCERFLRQTLESVLSQDLGTEVMQIEVVDDGSTLDDPERVVTEVGQGRVAFYRQPQNVGHTKNFEACLKRARGKVIHLLHGDDYVLNGFYHKLQRAFETQPEIGAAFCRQIFMDNAGNWEAYSPLEQPESGILYNGLERLALEQRIMTPSIVVRRDVYERLGGFDSRLICSEDWEMWVRISAQYRIWYETEPLAAYRMHSDSNTGRHVRNGDDMRYTRMAIEICKSYLPLDKADQLSQMARETYALSALDTAYSMFLKEDLPAMLAQGREAIYLSYSPKSHAANWKLAFARGKGWPPKNVQGRGARMTMSKPLTVALVGCGAVTKLYYTPALQELERLGQVQVAALFDPDPANAASVQQAFPAAVPVGEFDELTSRALDLAIVASPPQYHASQTIQLLRAGKSVLCEKPMALSVAEGEAMVTAASDAQRHLAIGLIRRFLPAAQMIRTLLSRSMLGDVRTFSFSEGRVFKWPVQSASYFRGNGVLRDIGVHVLDLLIWWWGEPEEIIYEDDAMGGVDLNCRIQLKFPQGFSGEVKLSREFRLPNACVIQCRDGNINWDVDESNQLQIGFHDSSYYMASQLHTTSSLNQGLIIPGPVAADFHQCFVNQIKNVIAAIRGTESLMVPGEAGLASLRAIEYCYSQRALMDMPWFGELEILRAQQIKDRQLR